jgi:Flp pilus assembly pilin Flp
VRSSRVLVVAVLTGLFLSVAGPAFAKGDWEIVISGGGRTRPVTVSSSDVYAVRGVIWFPHDRPATLSGPVFTLDIYDLTDGHRYLGGRWLYYPAQGGALIAHPSADTKPQIEWESFSPGFQKILNDAIHSEPRTAISYVLLFAFLAALLVGAFVVVRKELTTIAQSPGNALAPN